MEVAVVKLAMPPRERREPGVDVPKPENSVVDVAMRLWNTPRPATESLEYGEVVPMPTLPSIINPFDGAAVVS